MEEALPRQDDALADRCAFAVMLARENLRFCNARAKFSERRSEPPDVTSHGGKPGRPKQRKENNNSENQIT